MKFLDIFDIFFISQGRTMIRIIINKILLWKISVIKVSKDS